MSLLLLAYPLPLLKADDDAHMSDQSAVAFVQQYCLDCHDGESAEGGFDIASFAGFASLDSSSYAKWDTMIRRVRDSEMPPLEHDVQPAAEERTAFVEWMRSSLHTIICDDGISAGPPTIRRLNRDEYGNTIRDLLGIHVNAAHALPADGAGGEGFDNAAETLFISPIHAEKYLDAAKMALEHAFKDPRGRRHVLPVQPDAEQDVQQAAAASLRTFLPRAFRRPVTDQEIDEYLSLFQIAYQEDGSFEQAMQYALQGVLLSPKFLFRWETPPRSPEMVPLDDFELASRLSYFLWASMPDDRLLELAGKGELSQDDVLRAEVLR
ncbi:MAG: DUF1587 domain-containing protein, partial [Planctomycetales bacterium]|nr:DUF1587 domain-containing protein [Planctomycetales bacterium]